MARCYPIPAAPTSLFRSAPLLPAMHTELLAPTAENLRRAGEALRDGKLVAIPTETVYGLAANALDARAVAQIFAVKERPTFDPLIVHVEAFANAHSASKELTERGLVASAALGEAARSLFDRLARAFWPGPLTVVVPRGPLVPELVTSGLASVAVRVPSHPLAQAVLRAAGLPLAAPSANRFGRISPTRPEHVLEELGGRIPFVLDGGACELGVESTVVALSAHGALSLLRPGGVPSDEIARLTGVALDASSRSSHAPASPGMLEHHYAPSRPLLRLPRDLEAMEPNDWDAVRRALPPLASSVALLRVFGGSEAAHVAQLLGLSARCVVLSERGDPREAAQKLFGVLRELDASPASALLVELPSRTDGLVPALADRLRRASVDTRPSSP